MPDLPGEYIKATSVSKALALLHYDAISGTTTNNEHLEYLLFIQFCFDI